MSAVNRCSKCLGAIVQSDGNLSITHDRAYGYFGKTLCAMTVQEHETVVRLQLEGGRA